MLMDSANDSGEEAADAQSQSASIQPISPQPDVSQSASLQSDILEPENPVPDSPELDIPKPDSLQQQEPPAKIPEIDNESHSTIRKESTEAYKQNDNESDNHEVIDQKINEPELRDNVDVEEKGSRPSIIEADEEVGEEGDVEKKKDEDMIDEKGDEAQQEVKVSDTAVDDVITNVETKSSKSDTPKMKTTEIKPLPVDNKKTTHKQKNTKSNKQVNSLSPTQSSSSFPSKRSVFNRSGSPSMCSPEYAIDTMVVEEYEDASRLLKETNARLATDADLARQHSLKLSHAFNKRIKAAQERIEDLERELQITFDTAVHFETLYENMKLEEGTNKSSHCAPQTPNTITIQPKEIDVKYLSLVEENKYLKEEMKKLKDENKLLKMRTNESFIDVQHHKKQLAISYSDREMLQKKLHNQQQQNKRLNQSMTKQTNAWIQNKQQERKLDRERQFQRSVTPISLTGGKQRCRSKPVKSNDDKPRNIPVESWASENPLKTI